MKALKWINTGAFAAMIGVNALANLLPIGGSTTGQISEAYPNLFTPAPITFAIWGVIYLLTALFVVYQWGVFDHGVHSAEIRESVGLWFAVSCVLNIAWIFLWHYKMIGLSTIAIFLLLISLIVIQSRLKHAAGSFPQRMAAKAGLSLYYGWIVAATIANVSVFLTKIGWNGWGIPADIWVIAMLLAGAAIASFIVQVGGNRIAGIAVMWAFAGILIRHISPLYYAGSHPYVIIGGVLAEFIILLALLAPMIESAFTKYEYIP